MLKIGGTAAVSILASGIGSAQGGSGNTSVRVNSDEKSVRLRGTLDSPIGTSELKQKRDELLKRAKEVNSSGEVGVAPISVPDHGEVIAYNCDLVDGSPKSWIGTIEKPSSNRYQTHGISAQQNVGQTENKILQDAESHAESIKTQTQSRNLTIQSHEEHFDEWTGVFEKDYKHYADRGNSCGWTINWRQNPDNTSEYGVQYLIRAYPNRDPQVRRWRIGWADCSFEFNESRVNEVADWQPKSSVGTVSGSVSLGLTSTGEVSIGVSSATTDSELEVTDRSQVDFDKLVKHKYNVQDNLRKGTVVLHQEATVEADYEPDKRFTDFSSTSRFNRAWSTQWEEIYQDNYLKWKP